VTTVPADAPREVYMHFIQSIIDRIGTGDVIAVSFTMVACWLYATTGEIPDTLLVLTSTIVGAFYGKDILTKGQTNTVAALNPKPAPPYVED